MTTHLPQLHGTPTLLHDRPNFRLNTTGWTPDEMLSILMVVLAMISVGILATLLVLEWPRAAGTRAGEPERTD